jgi:release factor glutamine methyltransferase
MAEHWTLRKMIGWIQADLEKRGFSAPRLDADLIVAQALGIPRVKLYLDLERPLIDAELAGVRALVERRRRHEPMAYLLGEREFFGHSFVVNRDVLIPRPDTEVLVERALAILAGGEVGEGDILDVCTGSGAIALSILKGAADRRAVATDLSSSALATARENAEKLGLTERIRWLEGDLFTPLPQSSKFALIAINPPYIGSDELASLMPDVRDFEPRMALDAGVDALSFYRRIASEAGQFLATPGVLLVEVGSTQAADVANLLREAGFSELRVHLDYGGNERVVEAWQR